MSAYIGHCEACGESEAIIDTTGDDNNHTCVDCLRGGIERQIRREAERRARRAEFDAVIRDIALRTP